MSTIESKHKSHRASYDAGYDAGLNGASVRNSHFGFFGSPEATAAWESGKTAGDAAAMIAERNRINNENP